MLAAFVFFSVNTVHIVETAPGDLLASADKLYHFDFDTVEPKGPHLNLISAILVNYDNGRIVHSRRPDQRRPIASLTKLVTAMVVLDKASDLSQTATITKEDARRSSRSRLKIGFELTLMDLLYAALMNSDNRAARALARTVSGSYKAFAAEMNIKAKQLGLRNTRFTEPTGLDSRNVSTAHEVAKILHYAFDYPVIAEITSQKDYSVKIRNRSGVSRQMANTNLLIHSRHHVLAGKTGYIRAADYCLASIVQNSAGERLTLVVLGVPGDRLRFREARRLLDWGFGKIPSAGS